MKLSMVYLELRPVFWFLEDFSELIEGSLLLMAVGVPVTSRG